MTGSMIGSVFNNRYQITERIGIGGMAEVYRAQDTVLGRTVAVKVMLPQYAADPAFAKRFKQEAASAANLQSPYIVNIYDWGQDDGTYYIVMEYVRGSDLKTGIQERGAINQRKVAEIGSQVCRALSVAHQQDIIHRDIKPQNIMVQPDGNVKVMDFGIARAKNSVASKTSSVLGTAHYISPEQAQGKELTAASDIYSLGVVLYEAATGQLPFDGPDAVSVALKQVNEYPVPPREINPDLDPALEAIIMKAMEKNPRDRFATANEMRAELNNFLGGRPVSVAGGWAAPFGAAETAVMAGQAGRGAMRGGASDGTAVMPVSGRGGYSGVDPVRTSSSTSGYRADRNDEGSRGPKKGIIIAIVAIIAVIAVAVGAFALMGGNQSGEPVPNVIGMSEEEATRTLEDAGFVVAIERDHDDSGDEDTVIRQDPRAETRREKGSTVTIIISLGAEEVSVPDLTNKTADEAKRLIEAAGLVASSDSDFSTEYEKGRVMDQNPKPNEAVQKGSTVTYVVSLGAESVDIPNVEGWLESEATQELRNAGFEVSVQQEHSDTVSEGRVIRYSPTGMLNKGDTVTIVVSLGPESTLVTVPYVVNYTLSSAITALQNAGFSYQLVGGSEASSALVIWQSVSGQAEPGTVVQIETEAASTPSGGGGTGDDTEEGAE